MSDTPTTSWRHGTWEELSSELGDVGLEQLIRGRKDMVRNEQGLYIRVLALTDHDDAKNCPLHFWITQEEVFTVYKEPAPFFKDIEEDSGIPDTLTPVHTAMLVIDYMLTDYLDARDTFETELDKIDLAILKKPHQNHLQHLQKLRKHASKLREALAEQRDLFDTLGRAGFLEFLSDGDKEACERESRRYTRITEAMEVARELVNGSLNLYTSRLSDNTNQTMHILTVVTVVMGLSSTLAGVMGMNFEAELFSAKDTGFWWTVGLIALSLAGVGAWGVWKYIQHRQR